MAETEGFFPVPDAPVTEAPVGMFTDSTAPIPQRVPKNVDEVASQIIMAVDSPVDNATRFAQTSAALRSGNMSTYITQALEQEHNDKMDAAKQMGEVFLKTRNSYALQKTVEERVKLEKQGAPNAATSGFEGNLAITTRALERMSLDEVYKNVGNLGALDRRITQAAGDVASRNIILSAADEKDKQSSILNHVTGFFRNIIPFFETYSTTTAVDKVVGSKSSVFDKMEAIDSLRTFLIGIPSEAEKKEIIGRVVNELSSNPAVAAQALKDIAALTQPEANFQRALDVVGVTIVADVAAIYRGLAGVVRRGTPAKAVADVAGTEAAAKIVVDDIMTGLKTSGLTKDEIFQRAIAAGASPGTADPALLKGMSPAIQKEIETRWNAVLRSAEERLDSSVMSAEEKAVAREQIRSQYMGSTNKSIVHVIVGEGSDTGVDATIYTGTRTGNEFASEAAAIKTAQERGLTNYKIVPASELEAGQAVKQAPLSMEGAWQDVPTLSINGKNLREGEDVLGALRIKGGTDDATSLFNVLRNAYASKESKDIITLFESAFNKGRHTVTGKELLTYISTNSTSAYKFIADSLLGSKGLSWDKLKVNLTTPNIQRALGQYNGATDMVSLSTRSMRTPETILHELIHAHSSQVTQISRKYPEYAAKFLTVEQRAASKELQTLWERWGKSIDRMALRGADDATRTYINHALKAPEELLALGLTNKAVRSNLEKTSLRSLGYDSNESVWTKLWDVFSSILGIKGNDSALAQLTKIYDNLLSSIDSDAARTIGNRINDGTAKVVKQTKKVAEEEFANKGARGSGYLIKQTTHDPYAYKNLGKYTEADIKSSAWVPVDPKHNAAEIAVEARVIGVHAEAKVQKALVDFITPYWRGLSNSGKARIKSLLEEGDSFSNAGGYGKEFSFAEALGKGLSEKEATAYIATRQLRMAMYHIRNGEMVRHLRAMGMQQVEFLGTSVKTVAQVVEKKTGSVYDTVTKKMLDLNTTPLPANQRIIKLAEPTAIDGELRTVVAISDKTANVKQIDVALHYRPGEYSRIYSDEYFVKMSRKVRVDGVEQTVTETIRTAPSLREAQEYAIAFYKAIAHMKTGTGTDAALETLIGRYVDIKDFKSAYAAKQFDGLESFTTPFTRSKEDYLNNSISEAISSGRLFTSKRSERIFSTDATKQNTLGVFESLEAEITNVSRVASITQWRETNIRKWMNTFGDMVPNRTGDDVADFFSVVGAKITGGGKNALFAERQHAYIMRQIGLKTAEERAFEHMTQRATEAWFAGNSKIETLGQKIRQLAPLDFIRNVNFNLTLGMFNPAQLLVQANGAATALVMHPIHGAGAVKTFPLLRLALMSDNPSVWKALGNADSLTSLGMKSSAEFVDLVKAVRQTGIIDNIQSTALFNRENGRLNIFNSYPSRLVGSNTMFFNRGEEFSRLISFDVARRQFMAANKEIAWNSKEGLASIVVRMDDLTQNMTKANLARFQEGLVSIPLQFAQYNIKLFSNVLLSLSGRSEGRGFSKEEAVKLLAGHLVLYGAAGNGLTALVDQFLPKEQKETMSIEQKIYVAQGLLAGLVHSFGEALTGERTAIALGSRLGSFDYYYKLADAAFNDPKNIYEVLLGPSLGGVKRIGVIGQEVALWARNPDLSGKSVLYGLSKMTTEQVASLRNAAKAYLYMQHQGNVVDSKGVTLAKITSTEVLGQALGFQPAALADVSNLIRTKKDHTEAIKDIAELVFKVQKDIMTARARGDDAHAEELHGLLSTLFPRNMGDFMEVQRMVRERLYPYDNEMSKLMAERIWKPNTAVQPMTVTTPPSKEK